MKLMNVFILTVLLVTGCAPPVHDDPNATNQVAEMNGFWAWTKDRHFDSMHNNYIDDLMINGNAADGLIGLATENAPGCAVGVVKNNQITYLQNYGYATETTRRDMSTITPVASISKTITAVAIMRMVEEGLLDLDVPIDTYMGDAGVLTGLTLTQLLSLDAGVTPNHPPWTTTPSCPDSLPAGASTDWCLSHPRVAFDAIKNDLILEEQTDKYSNISIVMAAAALDQVSYDAAAVANQHRGYEAWVWHQLAHWANNHNVMGEFTSMALTHSWRDGDINNYADGFDCNGGCGMSPTMIPAWDEAGIHEGWWGPAGGWAMTIGDLARFAAIIDTNTVLIDQPGNSSWDTVFDDHTDVFNSISTGSGLNYGLGAIVENWSFNGESIVWHGGDLEGYSSVWYLSRTQFNTYAVVIQCNGASDEATSFKLKEYAKNITSYARAGGDIYPDPDIGIGYASAQQASGHYLIDPEVTYLSSHKSLHIPWLLDHEVLISVAPEGRQNLSFTLQEGDLSQQGEFRPAHHTQYHLGSYNYQPERTLTTRPLDIALHTDAKPMALDNAVFEFGFSKQGSHIAESKLSGLIDLRHIGHSGFPNDWEPLCRISAEQDQINCQPCNDGALACLPVTWNTQAIRMQSERSSVND